MRPEILLRAYVLHRSDDAFKELVSSSLDQVYATALELADGTTHLAEEITLQVYWELGRNASRLSRDVVVASWLDEHTRKTAVKILREAGRSVHRPAKKNDWQSDHMAKPVKAAPRGLTTRICQGVLLNVVRTRNFITIPKLPALTWLKPGHARVAAACFVLLLLIWQIPFHKRNPIAQARNLQMVPS